jgi:hypothetical protein
MVRRLFLRDVNLGVEEQVFQLYPLLDDIRYQYRRSGQGNDILPNLESITWDLHSEPALQFGVRLFGSALCELVINMQDDFEDYDELDLIATHIDRASVRLTKLLVSASKEETNFPTITECVSSILEISSKSIVDMTLNQCVFMWLSRHRGHKFPALKRLEFYDILEPERDEESFQLSDNAFPALLSVLNVTIDDAVFWASFLSYAGSSLEEIHVSGFKFAEARCFFDRMGEHCSRLRILELRKIPHDTPSLRDTGIFLSLLRCRSITSFTLGMYHGFAGSKSVTFWSDEDICDIAFAWSSLEVFHIGMYDYRDAGLKPILSLRSVATLCTHCPRLRCLSIMVDGTNFPAVPETSLYGPSFALRVLEVGPSPIENSRDVAIFLHNVCPIATVFSNGHFGTKKGLRLAWNAVNEHMKLLQMDNQEIDRVVDRGCAIALLRVN